MPNPETPTQAIIAYLRAVVCPIIEGDVAVDHSMEDGTNHFVIWVPDEQVGLLVGAGGNTARSLRTLVRAFVSSKGWTDPVSLRVKNPRLPGSRPARA